MKKAILIASLAASAVFAEDVSSQYMPAGATAAPRTETVVVEEKVLTPQNTITLSVIGQGVSPENTISNAQALALAKRAAIADGYRLIAEKLNGLKVEGMDYIKNMVVQRTQVKTSVSSMIRHVNIVETKCSQGFCEVEMELKVVGNQTYPELAKAYFNQ